MPIYEYQCNSCGKTLEVIQKFSDEPMKECPQCNGALSKLISNTSFVLKGSGWYADGYSSASANKNAEGGNKPAGDSNAGSSTKTATG